MVKTYRLETGSIQWKFNKSRKKIQIMGGGFGNGKTTAAVMKGLSLAREYPGSNGLIARATYPKLNDTIRKEFISWCPPHWIKRKPTQDDNTLTMINDTTVNFRYISQKGKTRDDGTTTSNLLSASYDWIIVDQIEDPEIEYKDFLDLLGRLRGQTPYRGDDDDETMPATGPRWFIITANPAPGWFFTHVVKPYQVYKTRGVKTDDLLVNPETGECIIDLFEGSTYTNKANLPADYITTLEAAYKGQMRDRFLLGKWAAYEGLVHPEFNAETHILPRSFIERHMLNCLRENVELQVIEAYDFGLTNATCYMFAFVDNHGRVFVMDGFYEKNLDYTFHPTKIAQIRSQFLGMLNSVDPIRADPAIFKRSAIVTTASGRRNPVGGKETIAQLLSDLGLSLEPANNDVTTGIAKVNAYLASNILTPHPMSGELGAPLFYVSDQLTWFEDEISAYYWKKNPQNENTDQPIDRNDHAMNTTKYLLAKQPEPAEIVIPRAQQVPGYMRWQEHEVDRFGNIKR